MVVVHALSVSLKKSETAERLGGTYAFAQIRCPRVAQPGLPFTRKHYESGNMQTLQKQWTAKGVVWLTVISSAPGVKDT